MFSKNDERANESVLYKTKPNMFLGCKKAIYGVVLLVIIFSISPLIIKFIGKLQVYLISRIQLPLTSYTAIGFFVVILVVILYIIWQLLKWYSVEYILTDTRIIVKSGLLSTKKNYMPYSTIQDINSSQGFLARLFNVGSVSVYSAYDNNQIKLENISNPSKVEDIIFNNMMGYRNFREPPMNFQEPPRNFQENPRNFQESPMNFQENPRNFQESPRNFINPSENMSYSQQNMNQENYADEEYYDEFEPITPINRERDRYQPREYEYYPEEFSFQENQSSRKFDYEPYDENFERSMSNAMDRIYEEKPRHFQNENRHDEISDNHYQRNDEYYQNYEPKTYYDEDADKSHKNDEKHVVDDSSETVIRRHFDKFKK